MAPVLNVVPPEGSAPNQASPAQMRAVFDKQRETALKLRQSTAKERIAKLVKLRDAVMAHEKDWYTAGYADFKKPPAEVDIAEIWPVIAECNDAIRNVAGWMKPHRVSPTLPMAGTRAYIQSEPRGRCLLISPWNYPVNLTFGPLASAIAAGNTVIIKPSEMTPHLAAVMTKVVHEVFSEDEVAIFEGDASISTSLLEMPFDHIFFTGSPAIGKVVMAAAAKNLASVTLELGGKSPTIVDESADIDMAARNVLWAKYTNNGQTCIAPDHVFVHAKVKDAFVAKCKEVLTATYGADGASKDSPNISRIVNQRHTKRLRALLDDAKSRGAKALTGDVVSEDECFIAPTLLEGIPDDAKIMDEEIFGPILPILPFTDLDDVIRRINAAPKPLALYVWSRTEANIDKLMHQTSSGGACINHTIVQFLHMNLPFGGVNHSGIGNAHGHFGFKAFSHERGVVRTQVSLASMFFPPYTEKMQKLVKLMIRWS